MGWTPPNGSKALPKEHALACVFISVLKGALGFSQETLRSRLNYQMSLGGTHNNDEHAYSQTV